MGHSHAQDGKYMSDDNQKQDETTEVNSEASQSEVQETDAVSAADDTIADPAQVEQAVAAEDLEAGVADETFTGDEKNDVEDTAASAEPPKAPPPAPAASNSDDMTPLWRVEKDHGSVTRLLTRQADDVDLSVEKASGGRAVFNLVLVLLILGVTGYSVKLYQYHSAESTLDRKRQVNEALEEVNLREQQKSMPKFGNMRIESTEQYSDLEIVIMKRGSKAWQHYMDRYVKDGIAKAAADAVKVAEQEGTLVQQPSADASVIQLDERTPMSLMGTDISSLHVITAKMDGFEDESFVVGGEHIWEKDPARENTSSTSRSSSSPRIARPGGYMM